MNYSKKLCQSTELLTRVTGVTESI